MKPKLYLFDIDQTLILARGSGRRSLEKAFEEMFGIPESLTHISTHGKTDTSILDEMATFFNLPISVEQEALLWKSYLSHLRQELVNTPEAEVNPGIPTILEALQAEPEAHLGLLTGNIYEGARIKLSHFDLWHYFPTGGFGSDHKDRNKVAGIALERSSSHYGTAFEPDDIYVFGDSLRDIECAQAIGAKTVIVATGNDSYETLREMKPFLLFETFANALEVLASVQGKIEKRPNPSSRPMRKPFVRVVLEDPADFLNPYWYEQLNAINWIENGQPLVTTDRMGQKWNPRFPSSLFLNHKIKRLHLVFTAAEGNGKITHDRDFLLEILQAFPGGAPLLSESLFDLKSPSFSKLQEMLAQAAWILLPEGDGLSLFFTGNIGKPVLEALSSKAMEKGWELKLVQNIYDFHRTHAG